MLSAYDGRFWMKIADSLSSKALVAHDAFVQRRLPRYPKVTSHAC